MFENREVNGKVMVPKYSKWLTGGLSIQGSARYYNALTRFYIVETPVRRLSSSSVPLTSYGWNSPWAKPEYLNRKLKDVMSQSKAMYSAATRDAMEDALSKAGLLNPIDEKQPKECIVIYNCQKNQFMSTFYHIRNALCHGRFCYFKQQRAIWLALEDISNEHEEDDEVVAVLNARMLLKQSTLIQWQKLITKGPGHA